MRQFVRMAESPAPVVGRRVGSMGWGRPAMAGSHIVIREANCRHGVEGIAPLRRMDGVLETWLAVSVAPSMLNIFCMMLTTQSFWCLLIRK